MITVHQLHKLWQLRRLRNCAEVGCSSASGDQQFLSYLRPPQRLLVASALINRTCQQQGTAGCHLCRGLTWSAGQFQSNLQPQQHHLMASASMQRLDRQQGTASCHPCICIGFFRQVMSIFRIACSRNSIILCSCHRHRHFTILYCQPPVDGHISKGSTVLTTFAWLHHLLGFIIIVQLCLFCYAAHMPCYISTSALLHWHRCILNYA